MTADIRLVHRFILETFALTGRSPSLNDIGTRFSLKSLADAEAVVTELERSGRIHRNAGDANITHAYPFSNEQTAHRVQLSKGPAVFAMCAIDALGMPFMLKQDAEITSVCEQCRATITVRIEGQQVVR